MTIIVLSIGGSILTPQGKEVEYINSLAALLKRLSKENKLYIVVGGGPLARNYITIARDLGLNEISLDDIGIAATRLNARLLIAALGEFAYPVPAETFQEAFVQAKKFSIVVMGGTHPGHTTDAVAMMLGEFVGADRGLGFLINVGRGQYDTALVFVAIFTLVAMALALYGLVVLVETRLLSWQQRPGEN